MLCTVPEQSDSFQQQVDDRFVPGKLGVVNALVSIFFIMLGRVWTGGRRFSQDEFPPVHLFDEERPLADCVICKGKRKALPLAASGQGKSSRCPRSPLGTLPSSASRTSPDPRVPAVASNAEPAEDGTQSVRPSRAHGDCGGTRGITPASASPHGPRGTTALAGRSAFAILCGG